MSDSGEDGDFYSDANFGQRIERIVQNRLDDMLSGMPSFSDVRLFPYREYAQIQKMGIDGAVVPRAITFDVKTIKRAYYPNFFLETWSVPGEKVRGWYFTTQSDMIIYHWWDTKKDMGIKHSFLLNIKKFRAQNDIYAFADDHGLMEVEARETHKDGKTWRSLGIPVDIDLIDDRYKIELPPFSGPQWKLTDKRFENNIWKVFFSD